MSLIYLDTNVFIYALETSGESALPARRLLSAVVSRPGIAVTSELTLAELLAPVSRSGGLSPLDRRNLYLEALTSRGIAVLMPVTREILIETATLRGKAIEQGRKITLVDAIHVATAAAAGCRYLVSGDRRIDVSPARLQPVGTSNADVDLLLSTLHV